MLFKNPLLEILKGNQIKGSYFNPKARWVKLALKIVKKIINKSSTKKRKRTPQKTDP